MLPFKIYPLQKSWSWLQRLMTVKWLSWNGAIISSPSKNNDADHYILLPKKGAQRASISNQQSAFLILSTFREFWLANPMHFKRFSYLSSIVSIKLLSWLCYCLVNLISWQIKKFPIKRPSKYPGLFFWTFIKNSKLKQNPKKPLKPPTSVE